MSLNKLSLIYDTVVVLNGERAIAIDSNNNFMLYRPDGSFDNSYKYGCEILYGVFLFYSKDNKTCTLFDRNFTLIKETNRDDIGITIAKLLSNCTYETIKNLTSGLSTKLTKEFVNRRLRTDSLVRVYNSNYISITIDFKHIKSIKKCKVYKLSIFNEKGTINGTFVNGKVDIPIIDKNNETHKIEIIDEHVRILKDSDEYSYVSYNRNYGKMYLDGVYLRDVNSCKVISSNQDYTIYEVCKDYMYSILKVSGSKCEELISNASQPLKNKNSIIVSTMKEGSRLYSPDFRKVLKYRLKFNFYAGRSKVFSYTKENNEKVYMYFGKETEEACKSDSRREVVIGHIKSSDKLLSGISIIAYNDTKEALVTILDYKGEFKEYKNSLYRDMTQFWDRMVKLDNSFGLDVYAAYTVITNSYYAVDKYGNIIDNNPYESLTDIQSAYTLKMRVYSPIKYSKK